MTNRDVDSVARLLLKVADRLRRANERASASPHAAAATCSSEAYAIESLVTEYLTPRPRRAQR